MMQDISSHCLQCRSSVSPFTLDGLPGTLFGFSCECGHSWHVIRSASWLVAPHSGSKEWVAILQSKSGRTALAAQLSEDPRIELLQQLAVLFDVSDS